ncbi:hypothetical protein GGR57DRAFT_342231 [Xylariaceae sp. FL1272]|nr:hypothetical protein GGR57DRAFT_342231 [Xylariaceae sp. FL1272]
MDDPWGSPWATTDTPPTNDAPKQSEPDNSFLSPPPRAFFGSVTSLSPTQSPWANADDDDEFGGWSTADRPEASNIQSAWGAWRDSNSQIPRLSPRLSVSSKDSALAWPNNAVPSPALKSSSRSRTPSIFRQHSPDPWATPFSLNNNTESDLPSPLTSIVDPAPRVSVPFVDEPFPLTSSNAGDQTLKIEEHSDTQASNGKHSTNNAETTHESDNATNILNTIPSNTPTRPKPAIGTLEPPSRSSSLLSEDSHNVLEGQESPITSIDEDRGFRLQATSRKSSGKVQELVGVYDQLSRAGSEEPPVVGPRGNIETASRSTSRRRSDVEEDEHVKSSDFENEEGAVTKEARGSLDTEASPNSSSTLEAPWSDTPKRAHHQETGDTEYAPIAESRDPSAEVRAIFEKYGEIKFTPDLGLLDTLFPQAATLPDDDNGEHLEILDHVIRDSFASISERKAWYRISRYGSMRQHNSGDMETYRRVTWLTSNLHDDVVKIARRWMEEDAYAGRAVLGGAKRTGFFDWDSEATPVSLEEVFRRREAPKHARTASIPVNPVVARVASVDRPYRNSTGISLAEKLHSPIESATPTPDFGWNLGNDHNSIRPNSSSPIPPPTTVSRAPPIETTIADDDEDDWGEMVSSPVATDDPGPAHLQHSANGTMPEDEYPVQVAQQLTEALSPLSKTEEDNPVLSGVDSLATRDEPSTVNKSALAASSSLNDSTGQLADFSAFEMTQSETTKLTSNGLTKTPGPPLSMAETIRDISAKGNLNNSSLSSTVEIANVVQDAAIVEDILKNLPDFSYMLR